MYSTRYVRGLLFVSNVKKLYKRGERPGSDCGIISCHSSGEGVGASYWFDVLPCVLAGMDMILETYSFLPQLLNLINGSTSIMGMLDVIFALKSHTGLVV